jgi:hypothetical protein
MNWGLIHNIKPHFIGKKGKHSTFDEYIVNFPIPTPISDGVYARVSRYIAPNEHISEELSRMLTTVDVI